MSALQTIPTVPRSAPKESPRPSRRRAVIAIALGMTMILGGIVLVDVVPRLARPRSAPWWVGTHIDATGKPTPMLEVIVNAKGEAEGFITLDYDVYYTVRVPFSSVKIADDATSLIFSVPPANRNLAGPVDFYLLKKTGEKSCVLYRLRKPVSTLPARGDLIVRDLEEKHEKIGPMTRATGIRK